jgi:hypothetical protein
MDWHIGSIVSIRNNDTWAVLGNLKQQIIGVMPRVTAGIVARRWQ